MIKHFFVISVLIFLFSCQQQKETENASNPKAKEEVEKLTTREEENKQETIFVENRVLTQRWYDQLLKISKEDDRFKAEIHYQENRHVPGRTDTITTLLTGQTKLRIHATKGLYAVESAEIRTSDLELQDAVKVGMTKNDLDQILNSNLDSDHIQVGNKEQTYVFHFFFENDTLNRIRFQGYVD